MNGLLRPWGRDLDVTEIPVEVRCAERYKYEVHEAESLRLTSDGQFLGIWFENGSTHLWKKNQTTGAWGLWKEYGSADCLDDPEPDITRDIDFCRAQESVGGPTQPGLIDPTGRSAGQAVADTRTLTDLAREAIQIQDASNLSGLVHGWSRSVSRLRELLPDNGTDVINRHPISQLWAAKLHELAGMGLSDSDNYGEAYDACKSLAGN